MLDRAVWNESLEVQAANSIPVTQADGGERNNKMIK